MKKIFLLLLLVVFSIGATGASKQNKPTKKMEALFISQVMSHVNAAWNDKDKEKNIQVNSDYMRTRVINAVNRLYLSGLVTKDKIEKYIIQFEDLSKKQPSSISDEDKDAWFKLYENYAKSISSDIKKNPTSCISTGEVGTVGICCDKMEKKLFADFARAAGDSCQKQASECNVHSDCCSGKCSKEDYSNNEKKGSCAPVETCYALIPYGEQCDKISNPYCDDKNGSSVKPTCQSINHGQAGIGACKAEGSSCKSGLDCCSDECSGGSCVDKSICTICAKVGQSLKNFPTNLKVECCAGLYEGFENGRKCIPVVPILEVPQASHQSNKNILEKLVSFVFPSAHAAATSGLCNYFTEEEQGQIQTAINTCIQDNIVADSTLGNPGLTECMSTNVSNKKSDYRKAHYEEDYEALLLANTACADAHTGEPAAYKTCMDDVQTEFDEKCNQAMSMQDYTGIYEGIPAITSKTFSDPETCRFNSYNDNWRDASNHERNAELVLMGFEYVFSGEGAKDFWVEEGKNEDIFQRSKFIADNFRTFRAELTRDMHKQDIFLTCKCVLIRKGNVPSEVKEVFDVAPQCEPEKAILASMMAVGDEGQNTQQSQSALIASGILPDAYMMEFNSLRMQAQMKRFKAYAEIEDSLEELSEYVSSGRDFEAHVTNPIELYPYHVEWMRRDFLEMLFSTQSQFIFLAMTFHPFTHETFIKALDFPYTPDVVLGMFAGLFGIDDDLDNMWPTKRLPIASYPNPMNGFSTPVVTDVVMIAKNKDSAYDEASRTFVWEEGQRSDLEYNVESEDEAAQETIAAAGPLGWRYFGMSRQYLHDSHNNGAEGDLNCDIHAKANLCMRNVYKTVYKEDPESDEETPWHLVDLKQPLFVDPAAYEIDTGFIELLRTTHDALIVQLKATESTPRNKQLHRQYMFDHENLLMRAGPAETMKPLIGIFPEGTPAYFGAPGDTDNAKTNAVLAGIRKYSKCQEIKGSKASADCLATFEGIKDDDMGFGYFFETDEDINNFAAYVYEHHFWNPSLTSTKDMGYPLKTQHLYYQKVLENLRIIGSNAAQRGINFGELYDQYEQSWSDRTGKYNCASPEEGSSSCSLINSVSSSVNMPYSQEFRHQFKSLNFKMAPGMQGISNAQAAGLNSGTGGGFSGGSEADLLALRKNQAMKADLNKKKSAHFEKEVGKTARGKLAKDGMNKWNKAFSSPLSKMKMMKGGKSWGGLGENGGNSSSLADKSDSKKGQYTRSTYSRTKRSKNNKSINRLGRINRRNNKSHKSDNYVAGSKKSTGGDVDYSYMLDSADKSKKMFQADASDGIFELVSKAYFRNLDLIFNRRGSLDNQSTEGKGIDVEFVRKKSKLSGDKKEELKNLLNQ